MKLVLTGGIVIEGDLTTAQQTALATLFSDAMARAGDDARECVGQRGIVRAPGSEDLLELGPDPRVLDPAAVRFVLDGLDVGSLRELRGLVFVGRGTISILEGLGIDWDDLSVDAVIGAYARLPQLWEEATAGKSRG